MPIHELGRRAIGLPNLPADGTRVVILAALGGSWFYGPFEGFTL